MAGSRILLTPGHEAEWVRINQEEYRALTPAPDTPVEELLRRGMAICRQAGLLLDAVERVGDDRAVHPA
jgi:hypothetical protein